jgi:hypothetical protein
MGSLPEHGAQDRGGHRRPQDRQRKHAPLRRPPPNSALSDEYDVSERTVSAAKSILGNHGILILENRRYYVA